MKAATLLSSAVVAALARHVAAMRKVPAETEDERRHLTEEEQRALFSFTVEFDECVGEHLEVCQNLIQENVNNHPAVFGGRAFLNYEVTPVRTPNQKNYYRVGLRTDKTEEHVIGVLGDGIVSYPWQWCVSGNGCYDVGPWDCDVGTPLSVEQCCDMIKATVPEKDVNGNNMDCYSDPPVGSVSKPVDQGRVRIIVNDANNVVQAPKNE